MSLYLTNIVMTYPVSWPLSKIVNNYIQNFLDAIGPSDFGRDFECTLLEDSLVMSSPVGFAKEWLYYLGASTKRGEDQGQNAGGFGEGFKIAALLTLREHHLDIRMESRDWVIQVTTAPTLIAEVPTSLLAYEIGSRPYQENAVLTLSGGTKETREAFYKETMERKNDFWYQGNPLIGPALFEKEGYGVYLPGEAQSYLPGLLFAKRQRRSCFYLPLIFRNDHYQSRNDDRDRLSFSQDQIHDCVMEILERLNPKAAYEVLIHVQGIWYSCVERKNGKLSWEQERLLLVRRVSKKQSLVQRFQREFPHLATPPDILSTPSERIMARTWYQHKRPENIRLVHDVFHFSLHVPDLVELCKKDGGFAIERKPRPSEVPYILILKEAASVLLEGIVCEPALSLPVIILVGRNAPVLGYTLLTKTQGRTAHNQYGLSVRHIASQIYLQETLFASSFEEAFPVYGHELLHQFGGDGSKAFARALQLMNKSLYEKREAAKGFALRWAALEKGGTK